MDMSLVSADGREPWFGGANVAQDMNGEYEVTSGWSFKKTLLRPTGIGPWDEAVGSGVELLLSVGELRGRPRDWGARLRFGTYGRSLGFGKCSSIKGAKEAVDALDLMGECKSLIADAYRNDMRVECIYRLKDGVPYVPHPQNRYWGEVPSREEMLKPENWEPFVTDLGASHGFAHSVLPEGWYVSVQWQRNYERGEEIWKLRGCDIHRDSLSTSSSHGTEGFDGLAAKLGMWNEVGSDD